MMMMMMSDAGCVCAAAADARAGGKVNKLRRCIKCFVESRHVQRAILVAIMLNSVSMGIEYHNQVTTAHSISTKHNYYYYCCCCFCYCSYYYYEGVQGLKAITKMLKLLE